MRISAESFRQTAERVAIANDVTAVALDFETNGLHAKRGDRAFIVGVCIDGVTFSHYFFGTLADAESMRLLVSNPKVRYLAHNAHFEMGFLKEQWDVEVKGHVWDTEVMARVHHNNHQKYSLQACALRIGETKYPPMLAWLKANGPKYHEAPEELIVPYVEQDARLSWLLYKDQCDTFREWQTGSSVHISGLVSLEMKTTKNLFAMREAGLHLNVPYCEEADAYEQNLADRSAEEFTKLTGAKYVDSAKTMKPIFDSHGIPYGRTENGNPSFAYDILAPSKEHPIVRSILEHRDALKRSSTYWQGFLAHHIGGVIYPNIRQAGAASGRFSAFEPNVQNWPDDSESPTPYPIRRAFVAPPGQHLVSMDYKAMELCLMADEAGELQMIRDIIEGIDMHQRVANVAGTPRGVAKNARFAKLYGAGVNRVALTLGVSYEVALKVCEAIEADSPKIAEYARNLINYAKRSPFGYNWMGRRFFFNRGFEYKYPNFRIQGGCSEILRIAINHSRGTVSTQGLDKPQLIIPIHDELVFRLSDRDLSLIPQLRDGMIDAGNGALTKMRLDVSVHVGPNMHDMEKWVA